ncbi:HNH endonuclease (plasmid) [Pseudomonas sp. PLMAX]
MMTGDYSVRRDPEPTFAATLEEFEALDAAVITPEVFEAPEASTAAIEADASIHAPHEPITAPALPEITPTSYGVGVVDQFVVDEVQGDPVAVQRFERERSAVVRQLVMVRSQGLCEWCGQTGFIKHDGQIYLESHHIVPLHQDGDDTVENVIALCPNDHRMAHYAANREDLAIEMLIRVEDRIRAVLGAIKASL